MHDQKLIKIQDITNRLQRAQLMLEGAMEMNPKTDIDDLDTQLRR